VFGKCRYGKTLQGCVIYKLYEQYLYAVFIRNYIKHINFKHGVGAMYIIANATTLPTPRQKHLATKARLETAAEIV